MKYVIFDFNGTVIDDVDLGVLCINELVKKYLNRGPVSREEYTHVFTFPVKKYYENVGFDFGLHDWVTVAHDWLSIYNSHRHEYSLFPGIVDLLEENQRKGYSNILLSATKREMLLEQVEELGLSSYFDKILGIDNIYASGKVHLIEDFIKDKDPKDCVLIGDTLHDLDVARSAGVECILLSCGHQARDVLEREYGRVVGDIREVVL